MKKLFKFSFIGLAAGFTVVSVLALVLVVGALKSLPDVEELVESYAPSVPTTIYDSNEKVVDLISKEMREEVTMDEIPDYVKNAFVAIEDKRFYKHPGLDPIRLGKATLVNISKGRAAQGGSTITQQLAKNAFLSNEKKLMRKVKEALIAVEIEKKYSKEEILEKYMNEIYFGSGFYGIQTASKSIFNKKVSELSLPEAAMLVGIPNRPSYYNPRRNLENAVKRSHLVLKQMKKQELINNEEYEAALKHEFVMEKDLPKTFKGDGSTSIIMEKSSGNYLNSPDFTDIIERKLFELFDEDMVYEEGLQVYTSLDLEMQKVALETFNEYRPFKNNPKLQGALVTIDSSNGYVKSIVGGKNFKNGNFNRAMRAERQPGSAFKPFVYYTALEKGIPMNAVREDSEVKFGRWKPQNYGKKFVGDITLLEAMERSVNIIAIKLLKEVGIGNVIETVEKTGAQMDIPKDLTAALGTMTTTPYELAIAYIPFSNGGYKIDPVFITKVLNREGRILYENPGKRTRKFKSKNVSLLVHMMKDVVANGSGRNAKVMDRSGKIIEQGGKTGTTNGFRSAWYAGITPEYVTTMYVGYDDNSSMPVGSTGGSLAAPLWKRYYQKMINKGVYKPGKFQFMDEHIRNGDLVLADIDSRTGFAGDPTVGSKRTGLFKRGQEPEKEEKRYFLRLKGLFTREETASEVRNRDFKDIEAEIFIGEVEDTKTEPISEEVKNTAENLPGEETNEADPLPPIENVGDTEDKSIEDTASEVISEDTEDPDESVAVAETTETGDNEEVEPEVEVVETIAETETPSLEREEEL